MRSARLLLVPLAALVLAGCFTGKRPSFQDSKFGPGTSTGDSAIDAVLAKLDQATNAPPTFTASYDVVVRFGDVDKKAEVVIDGNLRSVTMGNVHFLQTPSTAETCKDTTCTPGIDPTAISDTQLTIDFWAGDIAKRLRFDATSKIGPTAQHTDTIAAQSASCVDVVQANNNTATYCVLDDGVLALLKDADVYITLTSFSPTADQTAFQAPG
jgi:hypothetical protein